MSTVNPTIGRIRCPLVGDIAEVRRDKKGKFYYVGNAGMIKPNLPAGQDWIKNRAEFFKAEEVKKVNENALEFGRRFNADAKFQAPQTDERRNDPEESGWWPL